jgi:hypothetical protein
MPHSTLSATLRPSRTTPVLVDGSLWGLQNNGQGGGTPGVDICATKAWEITTGSRDIVIAVIDSGIDYNHLDLAANMWRNVADCYNDGIEHDGNGYINDCYGLNPAYNNADPMDDTIDSHGTHVAGDIGAVGNNSEGVVGAAWQVSLMACKAFDRLEQGSDANIIACLDYVHAMKQRGVNIVATNNSYGGAGYDPALYDAIAMQMNDGTLYIATAGDTAFDEDNPDGAFYPVGYDLPNIVSVTAIDRFDKMWRYSGFGRHTVHLCALGDIIWSTVSGNSYNFASGTSEATAYATGVAALLKAQDPSRDWRAIKNLILAGGVNDPACSNILQSTITGKRLNAYGSMTCQNSPVLSRFRPAGSGWTPVNLPMGTQFTLEVLNINCAVPNEPISVTIQPGNIIVPLRDDGVWPDHAAGDGVFSAEIAASRVGSYTVVFPDGDNWRANVIPAYTHKVDTFNWRTITGTNLNLSDDSTATVSSPFPFMFPESDYLNVSLPNPYQGYSHVVFTWWDDLRPSRTRLRTSTGK